MIRIFVDLAILVPLGLFAIFGRLAELLTFWSVMMIHELSHAATSCFLGFRHINVWFYPFRVAMSFEKEPDPKAACWIALFGPLANLSVAALLVLFRQERSLMTLFHFGQGLLNLMPWAPLDGGRIFEYLKGRLSPFLYIILKWSVTATITIIFVGCVPSALFSYLYMLCFLVLQFISQKRALKKMDRAVLKAKKLVDNEL